MIRMAGNDLIKRFEERATAAERLIDIIKRHIDEVRTSGSSYFQEINRLKVENNTLRDEIELWKRKLINAETSRGIRQFSGFNTALKIAASASGNGSRATITQDLNPPESKVESPDTSKLDKKGSTKKEKKNKGEPKKSPTEELPVHFGRLDMRVGLITSAKKHPDADSLYIETVDVGEEKPRTVISGLVKFIPENDMQNRMAILMCNLKPSKMRGIVSEAMVMCASTPDKVEILSPPEGSKPGDLVYVEGYDRCPDAQLNPKKKIFEACAPDLKTNSSGVACYKEVPWSVNGKHCTSQSLKDAPVK